MHQVDTDSKDASDDNQPLEHALVLQDQRRDEKQIHSLTDVIVEEEEETAPPTYESLYADNKSENDKSTTLAKGPSLPPPYE